MSNAQSPQEFYRHTQFGTVVAGALGLGLALCLGLSAAMGWPLSLLVPAVLTAAALFLFHSLTTVVTSKDVRIAFGPGLISKTIPISDITNATPTRGNALWGWGIRYVPRLGWMWNVSGFDVVKLDLANGKSFGVGTSDPQGLTTSIREARAAR
ncbi:MAG: hypothetical protein AAGM22_23945 [Acidobacteriota bacterium]